MLENLYSGSRGRVVQWPYRHICMIGQLRVDVGHLKIYIYILLIHNVLTIELSLSNKPLNYLLKA